MRITISVFMLLLFSIVWGCNSTEPNKTSNQNIELTFVDAASIEAWVEINTKNVTLPAKLTFTKNDKYVFELNLSKADTIICLDSLMPKTNYTIEAATNEKKSNKITFETLDTTSHNFTWETFEFGNGHGSSDLYDVTIIDENNIWAVGEFFLNDSLGNPDDEFYNVVKWDGNGWKAGKIYYPYNGYNQIVPLYSTYSFSINDVWVGTSLPMNWTGKQWRMWDSVANIWSGWINGMWGGSSSNIYIVGDNGNLAYYNGINWQKLESGTDWMIHDVFGYNNYSSQKKEVLCVAADLENWGNSLFLKITNETTVEKIVLNINDHINSVWTKNGFPLFICGNGLYSNKNGKWEEIKFPLNYMKSKIIGNGLNDIFISGANGLVLHYNGKDWKELLINNNVGYFSLCVKDNIVAFVGISRDGKGIITIGRRN